MMTFSTPLPAIDIIKLNVKNTLEEDVGSGDITAMLIPQSEIVSARVISRENAVLCGKAWVEEVFRQVNPSLEMSWKQKDGDRIAANETIFTVYGSARQILTAERSALNFLQLLSGTATLCADYATLVKHTQVKLLDTRKTLPGLRHAQKYAVACGGCHNHRMGLFDAFLIKENHILACGSISAAILKAREIGPAKSVEVEVESFDELVLAVEAKADTIMLDNFTLTELKKAVTWVNGRAKLEASGGISKSTLVAIAETGVDFISIGALTKDCQAIDLSMRVL